MAAQVKSEALFSAACHAAIAVEKSRRGLGNMFHEAVIALLNENPASTADELVEKFHEVITVVENTLQAELKAEFGEDATAKDLGSWTQYKSNYKSALKLVDRRDIMSCTGPGQLNTKLQEVRKALKEKENGGVSTDDNPTENGAAAGGGAAVGAGGKVEGVSSAVNTRLHEAMKLLAQLPEDAALEAAEIFKNAAAARLRKLGHAKKKVGATAGNGAGAKVAANH